MIILQIYGYEYDKDDSDIPLELIEASIYCTIEELDKIIKFLQYVRGEFEKEENSRFQCHEHYRDWDKEWLKESADLIIINNNEKID